MPETKEETTVHEVDSSTLDAILNPGASSVMTTEDAKPSIFQRKPVDLSFLDKAEVEDKPETDPVTGLPKTPATNAESNAKEVDSILSPPDDDDSASQTGRPKVDKQGLVDLAKKLIEKGQLIPFDDDKPIEKYTVQDFEELFEINAQERDKKIRNETPAQFFDSLPEELQFAAKYVADGGSDLKGLFRSLAAVEEVKNLDASTESGQELIVRSYLQATQFGDAEEIQEEIDAWKDRNELEAKANKFKPKLDSMQEQIVSRKLREQEVMQGRQREQAQHYMQNVYNILEPGELNGQKLDKKTQSMLYAGLVQPNYPSISGKNTNLLGHLLEKYQFVEPNHGLIAEALWLLADPEGYRTKLREGGKKDAVAETVRSLKTEEARKLSTTADEEDDSPENKVKGNRLQRPVKDFFRR